MAQLGGFLSLYMGVSLASLVHIPVFFIRLLASVVGSKTGKSLEVSTHHTEMSVRFEAKPNEEIEIRLGTQQGEISSLASRLAALEERNAALEERNAALEERDTVFEERVAAILYK